MEQNNTNYKKQISIKEILGAMMILTLLAFFVLVFLSNESEAKDNYIQLTPQAQVVYDEAFRTLCEAEKNLANAKLMDVANGVDLNVDLNLLQEKRNKTCSFR